MSIIIIFFICTHAGAFLLGSIIAQASVNRDLKKLIDDKEIP